MRILFFCGSLKAGKNGVGDYTRRLAGELIRQGHECRMISFMDKHVDCIVQEIQVSELTNIIALRLPFDKGFIQNISKCKTWVDEYDPQWISIQYVPFSFHVKGLHLGLALGLHRLTKGRKVHIMCHELWVAMDTMSSLKYKVWGYLQKKIIYSFLKILKPDLIHTNTSLYINHLIKLGFRSYHLPLFGNVPVFSALKFTDKVQGEKTGKNLSIAFFGTIHHGAPIDDFIECLHFYASKSYKVINVKFIGRCGEHMNEWVTRCNEAGFIVNVLGELTDIEISKQLLSSDFGITTTPYLLVEKSGTVAAMLEHCLPVLCVSRIWFVDNYISKRPLSEVVQFKDHKSIEHLRSITSGTPTNMISAVSLILTNSFSTF